MKKQSGFTLLEILLYVVIGGITLTIASFSFVQINRLFTSFRVNSELNQSGKNIIEQIQNLINDSDYILTPKQNNTPTNNLIIIKNNIETNISQSGNNITVSYSNGSSSFNLNPTGILISNNPSPTLSFEQIASKDNVENIGLSQTIKVKFTLIYNKPTLNSSFEYDSEKKFENTITMTQKTSSFQPILNTYPTGNNGVAYGLRKLAGLNTNTNQLSSSYSGPAIRVRRDRGLDQSEMDIGFNSKGDLNTVALQSFVGSQNFFNYSEDISNTNWVFNNITTTTNTLNTLSPDNSNNAETTNLSAGNNQKFLSKSTNIITGSTYTDSYYVKANNGYNFVQIAPETGFSSTAYQNYNLSNGTLGGSSGISSGQANIQSVGNGWYRISLSATATSSTSGRMILAIVNSSSSARLENINILSTATDSIFVWGGMRHLGSSLKSYQQTLADPNTGDGYVTTWYDQSGNKNNAIQTTTGFQPKIVDGVNGIINMNNRPVIQFDGNDQLLNTSFNNTDSFTVFFIASRGTNNQSFMARISDYATLGAPDLFNTYYLNKSSSVATTGADTKNSINLYTAIRTSPVNSSLAIGAGSSGNFLNGNMSELIIYDGNKLGNKITIENNLRDYYNTP